MALEFSTIGVKLKYGVEASAGTRPTSGMTEIPDIKNIPGMNLSPNMLPVTNLTDQVERNIPGVKTLGGEQQITANMTASLRTLWESVVSAAETAMASGKSTWFEVCFPNHDSFWYSGMPTMMGFNDIEVDAVVEATLHIIPNTIVGFAAAST